MRPLSPHLQHYKLPMTAILSIMHRLTGVCVFGGALLFLVALACLKWQCFDQFITFWVMVKGPIWVWLIVTSFHYHVFNGLRYMVWTTGRGLSLKAANLSGWVVLILSFLTTGILYYLCL